MAILPELCSIQYGYAFDSACFTEDSTYFPLVRIRDVKRGYSETFYSGIHPNDYIIDNGSLLVGMDGEFNIARWKGGKALLNQRVCKITARKNVDEEYLRFALTKALKEIENRTSFVTVKHLSAKELNRLEIDIPDYRDQISISGTLTKIENIIFTRQQQLQKLDELVKARFVELFGDPLTNPKGYQEKYLSEIAEYWNGLTYKPDDVANEGTIVLRSSNIQNASLDFADTVRVNCKIGTKKYVQDNDILMCSRNGSAKLVGKVALIKELSEPMSFGAFMMIIRSAYYPFLMTYFQLPAFRSQITTGATTTINQITGRMLDNVKLAIPDIESAKDFSAFTNQVDKSKVAVQKSLDEAQLLFDSLMQQYFG